MPHNLDLRYRVINIILTGDYQINFIYQQIKIQILNCSLIKLYGNKDNINVKIGIIENETTGKNWG